MNTLSVLSIPADTTEPIATIEINRSGNAVRAALGIDNNFETCITGDENIEFLADEESAIKEDVPYNSRASVIITELLSRNGYSVLSVKNTPRIFGNVLVTGGVDLEQGETRSLSAESKEWILNYLAESTGDYTGDFSAL